MMERVDIEITIKFLDKEPKPASKITQKIYKITRPLAEFLDGFNLVKLMKIDKRRSVIRILQKWDFIETVAEALYDEVLTYGTPSDEDLFIISLFLYHLTFDLRKLPTSSFSTNE